MSNDFMRNIASYRYTVKLDLDMDARNWYQGCNKVGHGVDWKSRVDLVVAEKIHGKSEEDANKFLLPYLRDLYEQDRDKIQKGSDFIKERYKTNFLLACNKMTELTGKPLYRNDFTIFITTFPRGPYNFHKGQLWSCYSWTNPVATFMHELLHFQFIQYWRLDESSLVSRLDDDTFERLKEALTVILDDDLVPIIERPDRGYEIHKDLRDKLHALWKQSHDFDALVQFGLQQVCDR
jgi:hypothetical protein